MNTRFRPDMKEDQFYPFSSMAKFVKASGLLIIQSVNSVAVVVHLPLQSCLSYFPVISWDFSCFKILVYIFAAFRNALPFLIVLLCFKNYSWKKDIYFVTDICFTTRENLYWLYPLWSVWQIIKPWERERQQRINCFY